MWDVKQYEVFHDERARPFLELLSRVPGAPVHEAADLGCGTGELTALLTARWPEARVVGVDSSADMLAGAAARAIPGRLEFVAADLRDYRPARPLDLIISNATLHWLPDHGTLLERLVGMLAPGGRLAVGMPGNFDQPSHTLLAEVAADGPWAARLAGARPRAPVMPLEQYVETLWRLGLRAVDAWETTYLHVLPGEDAVFAWAKGTTLRPFLARLDDGEREAFLAAYAARLREAYPRRPEGTIFPFRRVFFVAHSTMTRSDAPRPNVSG